MKWTIGIRLVLGLAIVAGSAACSATAAPTGFTLKEAGGNKTFSLSQAKGHYVALHFLLKTECPNCQKLTQAYATKAATVAGVEQVFIKPDSERDVLDWEKGLKLSSSVEAPAIYLDPDAKIADEFGIPNGYEFHGETVHYPALVIIDPSGKEVFRYVGKGTSDRYPFEKFVAKMAELKHQAAVGDYNLDKSGLALQGYDPVSYFGGKPAEGKKDFATKFAGASYYFADAKNRDTFLADPGKFLPAYGGWCATAMAQGKKVEIDPENYKITNGRLFLFYKNFISNAINDWNKDEPTSTAAADKYWRDLTGE